MNTGLEAILEQLSFDTMTLKKVFSVQSVATKVREDEFRS